MRQLPQTKKAIQEYDIADAQFSEACAGDISNTELMILYDDLRILERIVGIRFGWETKDINDLSTCASCVRPGPAIPGSGKELSFVRMMVKKGEGI